MLSRELFRPSLPHGEQSLDNRQELAMMWGAAIIACNNMLQDNVVSLVSPDDLLQIGFEMIDPTMQILRRPCCDVRDSDSTFTNNALYAFARHQTGEGNKPHGDNQYWDARERDFNIILDKVIDTAGQPTTKANEFVEKLGKYVGARIYLDSTDGLNQVPPPFQFVTTRQGVLAIPKTAWMSGAKANIFVNYKPWGHHFEPLASLDNCQVTLIGGALGSLPAAQYFRRQPQIHATLAEATPVGRYALEEFARLEMPDEDNSGVIQRYNTHVTHDNRLFEEAIARSDCLLLCDTLAKPDFDLELALALVSQGAAGVVAVVKEQGPYRTQLEYNKVLTMMEQLRLSICTSILTPTNGFMIVGEASGSTHIRIPGNRYLFYSQSTPQTASGHYEEQLMYLLQREKVRVEK